jgi:hypothetical protein
MVSSLQVFQPKFCTYFSSLPYVVHSPTISASWIIYKTKDS